MTPSEVEKARDQLRRLADACFKVKVNFVKTV